MRTVPGIYRPSAALILAMSLIQALAMALLIGTVALR